MIGLPGVLFVLPDSYVDPENKDYGGDCSTSYSTFFWFWFGSQNEVFASGIDIARVSVHLSLNMKVMF